MQVVLLQILQWVLRIILFLLLFIFILIAVVMIVPIRYQAEGEFIDKKPGIRGKVTWFFYLIHMKFAYEGEFRMVVRLFGFKLYDSYNGEAKSKRAKKDNELSNEVSGAEEDISDSGKDNADGGIDSKAPTDDVSLDGNKEEYDLESLEKEMAAEDEAEAELAKSVIQDNQAKSSLEDGLKQEDGVDNKKSLSDKWEDLVLKIQDIIQKVQDIIKKIQDGKLKVEHYLELWNKKETQVTFQRAKKKLGKALMAILPRKWEITGDIGFSNPATTGQFMGALGAMYPILGNRVKIVPDFENEIVEVKGKAKGHIRLGNLTYQLISLLLNRHCFKFIKLIFNELSGSKKKKEK